MTTASMNQNLINANVAKLNKKIDMQMDAYMEDNELTAEDEKILAAKEDEAFMKKVIACNTPEEMQKIFEEKDIHWTIEQVNEFCKATQDAVNGVLKASEELSDEELDEITGGVSHLRKIIGSVVLGLIGAAVGVLIGVATVATGGIGLAIGVGIVSAIAIGGVAAFCPFLVKD